MDWENNLHIGFCGPATLSSLEDLLDERVTVQGYPFRGSATLIREYLSLGHRVTLFTSSPEITEIATFEGPNLKIVAVPTRSRGHQRAFDFFVQERKLLIAAIREEQPDVLHANWTYEFGIAARQSRIPSLLTVHDWAPSVARTNRHPYWYFRWLMQIRCLTYPGRVSAPSDYIADRVTHWYRKPCLVIPNGIDINSFYKLRKSASAENLRIGMLNVGFSSRKNVQTALRAWAIARVEHPTATLVAAGPGYEPGGEAHHWAVDSDLDIQVDFVGAIESNSVPSWFSSLDVFLHPSVEESFGMVLLEAMAAGLPVIAGENAGAVPAVTGGKALLTDIHSSSSIADAIDRVFTDAALRTQLGSEGLAWCQRFSVAKSARRYVQELSNIAARK